MDYGHGHTLHPHRETQRDTNWWLKTQNGCRDRNKTQPQKTYHKNTRWLQRYKSDHGKHKITANNDHKNETKERWLKTKHYQENTMSIETNTKRQNE